MIDLTTLSAADGFIIQGDAAGDHAGCSVSSAGDVNGDGFDDLIVGALGGDDGGIDAGEAYVVFGKASASAPGRQAGSTGGDRSHHAHAADGFIIQGDAAGDHAGWSVSSAGDVNGDGFDDLIVGAPYGDDGGTDAGEAYVMFGGAFGASAAPVTTTGSAAPKSSSAVSATTCSPAAAAPTCSMQARAMTSLPSPISLFELVDGGTGNDTLALLGSGASFDFTAFADNKTQSIEAFDFPGSGNNTLIARDSPTCSICRTGRNFDFSGVATCLSRWSSMEMPATCSNSKAIRVATWIKPHRT